MYDGIRFPVTGIGERLVPSLPLAKGSGLCNACGQQVVLHSSYNKKNIPVSETLLLCAPAFKNEYMSVGFRACYSFHSGLKGLYVVLSC
jgi:hypothetical protein